MNPEHPKNPGPPAFARLGGWLFKHRTALPLPIVVGLLVVPPFPFQLPSLFWIGGVLVAVGELIRLWAVRHIGAISRTRSERLGPLIATGPFEWVRNPLYIGNLLLWSGFTVSAQLLPLLPVILAVLVVEYHAIVRWEEGLLESRLGDSYRAYASRVPRWMPHKRQSALSSQQSAVSSPSRQSTVASQRSPAGGPASSVFSWRDTFFSERGTLIAIVLGYLLLWLKARSMA